MPFSISTQLKQSAARGGWARRLVRLLVARYYPRIEVEGADRIPQTGPVLLCANHANSLIDPVMVGIAAGRRVRFLAKAPLFEAPLLGRVMYALGMIPAFRGSDDASQVKRNLESLDSGAGVLVEGEAMGIFPEGLSHDAAHVEMVRSGAARIALQAAADGAQGLKVVPLGLNYERKEQFRSAVWIRVGEPIDVDELLQQHDGNERAARRALTGQLEERLKQVVVHVDEPQWEPFLEDLELLAPRRTDSARSPVEPIRRRKRIAGAMNHFLAADRPRAEQAAAAIAAYRDRVRSAGLRVGSAILQRRGLGMALALVLQALWLLLLFVPALAGSLFHVVPFTAVRAIASRLSPPGKMTVALWRLAIGLPIYGLWYAAAGWWLFHDFRATAWFGWTVLLAMPFLGILALSYWRFAGKLGALLWHQLRFSLRRRRLGELRQQQDELRAKLSELAEEYQQVSPRPEIVPRPSRFPLLRRAVAWAVVLTAAGLAGWFGAASLLDRPLIDPGGGLDLAGYSADELHSHLDRDERSLRAIIAGLDELETRAAAVQADFAAGRRSYDNEADNNAVRQLLLSYVNYRAALLRLVWKYQRHADVEDEADGLRAFLLDYTAASVLCEASSKLVHRFNRSQETVARLNEGEPIWNIPPGLYDTISRNLASRSTARLLASARDYYRQLEPRFAANGLGPQTPHKTFHDAIARAERTLDEIGGPSLKQSTLLAAHDLKKLVARVHYDTQSAISTWIGDFKIREPRQGESLIRPEYVARLEEKLQPGDILIERRNWYVSNAFLPGYWPHAALYVGTIDDLKALGLEDDPYVSRHLEEFSRPDGENHAQVIVEAISEGVIFSSLEHSIGGGDSAAVLRPRLSREQIGQAISLAFSHAGKPYDFEFDFESHDKLVCTEVVYRAYGANRGPIDFPLKTILGRRTMPAIELIRKFQQEQGREDAQLDFVAFIDGNEETGEVAFIEDPALLLQTLDRPALTLLQGFESQPVRKLGSLGWLLLSLMATCTAGNLAYYARRNALAGRAG